MYFHRKAHNHRASETDISEISPFLALDDPLGNITVPDLQSISNEKVLFALSGLKKSEDRCNFLFIGKKFILYIRRFHNELMVFR